MEGKGGEGGKGGCDDMLLAGGSFGKRRDAANADGPEGAWGWKRFEASRLAMLCCEDGGSEEMLRVLWMWRV